MAVEEETKGPENRERLKNIDVI